MPSQQLSREDRRAWSLVAFTCLPPHHPCAHQLPLTLSRGLRSGRSPDQGLDSRPGLGPQSSPSVQNASAPLALRASPPRAANWTAPSLPAGATQHLPHATEAAPAELATSLVKSTGYSWHLQNVTLRQHLTWVKGAHFP